MTALSAIAAMASAFLALLFGQAAFAKLRNLTAAGDLVAGYGLLPGALVRPATWLLAAAETLVAVAMAIRVARPNPAGLGAGALLLLFAAAMAATLRRGRPVACGCGANGVVSWRQVAVTLLLTPLAWLTALPIAAPEPLIAGQAAVAGALLFTLFRAGSHLRAAEAA